MKSFTDFCADIAAAYCAGFSWAAWLIAWAAWLIAWGAGFLVFVVLALLAIGVVRVLWERFTGRKTLPPSPPSPTDRETQ